MRYTETEVNDSGRAVCLRIAIAIPASFIALMLINVLSDWLFGVSFGINTAHIAYHRAALTALFALSVLFAVLARPNWKSSIRIVLLLVVLAMFVYPIFTTPARAG